MHVYTDGACDVNPGGTMGIGVVVFADDGTVVHEIAESPGTGTSNEAEYYALLAALEWLDANGHAGASIYADSQLIVFQVAGRYECRKDTLIPLHARAVALVRKLGVILSHIPRTKNTHADRLSKRGRAQPIVLTEEQRSHLQMQRGFFHPDVPPNPSVVTTLLDALLGADPRDVADTLLATQCGRDAYSGIEGEALRHILLLRYNAATIAAMDEALAPRSPRTQGVVTRWAARGLPPSLSLLRANLEKAARMSAYPRSA